jgi:peptidoglycan-associated lipoprotein
MLREDPVKSRSNIYFYVSILMASFLLSACPPKKKMPIEEKTSEETEMLDEDGNPISKNVAPGDIEITQEWAEIPALQAITFGYDAAQLDEIARGILKQNVGLIKKLPATVTIRVEGHCDDRGTVEYNIALGERRANTVRSYYQTAGITKGRLETISFGEERPACTEATEDCWAKNRRGVTKVRNKEAIIIKSKDLK